MQTYCGALLLTMRCSQVSSTETGVIFGSILWEGPGMAEQCVILNDIHIDIMDYIKPAYCNEAQVVSSKFQVHAVTNNLL